MQPSKGKTNKPWMFAAVRRVDHLEMDGKDTQYSEDGNRSEALMLGSHGRGKESECKAHILEKATKRCEGMFDVVKETADYFFSDLIRLSDALT